MTKPEKFGHLPLVYHFTFPLGVKAHSKPWFDSEIFSAIQKKTCYTQDTKNEAQKQIKINFESQKYFFRRCYTERKAFI